MVAGLAGITLPIARSGVDLFALRLQGILLAHVFFNLPMASRLYSRHWKTFPANNVNLPPSLGAWLALLSFRRMAVVTAKNPAVAALIFMLCFASFATVLSLGAVRRRPLSNWLFIRR